MHIHVNYGGGRGEWFEIPDPEIPADMTDEEIEARLIEIYGRAALERLAGHLQDRQRAQRKREAS